MILEILHNTEFQSDYRWEVDLITDQDFCDDILSEREKEIIKAFEILVCKADLNKDKIELAYNLPSKLYEFNSVQVMELLMKPILSGIKFIFKDPSNNETFSMKANLACFIAPDWHIKLDSEPEGILQFIVKYDVDNWENF